MGRNGVILSTWNGGANWQLNKDFPIHLYGVHVFRPLQIYVGGHIHVVRK